MYIALYIQHLNTSEGPKVDDPEELTMKIDPLLPDEYVREAIFEYPNCQGIEMAKRYAISHLQKACWSIYQGDLVLLGNPEQPQVPKTLHFTSMLNDQ